MKTSSKKFGRRKCKFGQDMGDMIIAHKVLSNPTMWGLWEERLHNRLKTNLVFLKRDDGPALTREA